LCDGPADVTAALELLGHIDEVMRSAHATPDGPMIEERLHGEEVSVEALVADGEVCFVNVTDKEVFPGPHPVEAGHTIPSGQPETVRAELASAMQRLVTATGARTTVLHAEWIVDEAGTPWLVECAARVPGDGICDLISRSHSCSFVEAYLQLMRGETPARMTRKSGAAIRFIAAEPGVINEITGVEAAKRLPGVLDAEVSATVGQVAGAIGSSYSRLGHVMVTGENRAEAVAAADRARETIQIVTKPAGAAPDGSRNAPQDEADKDMNQGAAFPVSSKEGDR
jgi:biotin carboxylase